MKLDARVRSGPIGNLPVELLRLIWDVVERAQARAAAHARRALRGYIRKLHISNYWYLEQNEDNERRNQQLSIERANQWFSNRIGWTPREKRLWQRRYDRSVQMPNWGTHVWYGLNEDPSRFTIN